MPHGQCLHFLHRVVRIFPVPRNRFMRRFDVQVGHLYSPCVVGIRNDTSLYTESYKITRRILLLSEAGFMEVLDTPKDTTVRGVRTVVSFLL